MNIPEINYELLSETNEFQEKLDAFNLFYGSDIQVTKNARWKPGTYNKFKDIGVHQAFQNFHNGSGRTIRKLLYFYDYSLSTMKDKILKMMSHKKIKNYGLFDGNNFLDFFKRIVKK